MIIKTKIIIVIALTILLAVGATTTVIIKIQNTKMINGKLEDTKFLCDLIERTTENAMKEGNTKEVQKILENIGKNKEILSLRILSPDGTILKSANNMELGTKASEHNIGSSFQKPMLINDTTINYFHSITNRDECYACHDRNMRVIGIIQIKHDISRNFITFLSIKRMLIFSNIFVVLLVSFILSFLFSHLVMKPLRNLLVTINAVESGNWDATVKVSSNDELGLIGKSFNKMIGEINKLYRKNISKERELSKIKIALEHKTKVEELNSQLEFKIKEIETANRAILSLSKEVKNKNIQLEKAVEKLKKINEIGQILTSIIESKELIKIIIQTTSDLLNAEKVIMHLNNSTKPALTFKYQKGVGVENLNGFSFDLDQDYIDYYTHRKPIVITGQKTAGEPDSGFNGTFVGVPLKMKGQIIGAILLEDETGGGSFSDDAFELLTTLSTQAMVALDNALLYESLKTNYFSTIQSLVNALEASDKFTRGHSERVRLLSVELGRHIGLDFKELELLEHASILHDIGKIGIDNFILQKQGKLTPKEYSLVKTHPLIGDEILGPIATLDGVRTTIIQHHERYDGNGYPYGLRGDEISLKSKILSVADTFDAMMTDRPYRKAISLFKVKEELRINAGTQFDPYIVEAFVDMLNSQGDKILSSAGYNSFYLSIES